MSPEFEEGLASFRSALRIRLLPGTFGRAAGFQLRIRATLRRWVRVLNSRCRAEFPTAYQCASSYRGIHKSLINYGSNKMPEFLTYTHEESAIGMAHGYFKVTGKPLISLCHGTVGLQHATMGIYNAWCDRVPVIVMGGNDLDAAHRPPGVPTFHSAQDINLLVRDFTKWDDTPVSLTLRSVVRARLQDRHDPALRPSHDLTRRRSPAGPIHNGGEKLYIPRYTPTSPPQGDTGAVSRPAVGNLPHASGPTRTATCCGERARRSRPVAACVIQDQVMNADKTAPQSGALFAINMLAGTPTGRPTASRVRGLAARGGLADVRRVPLPGPNDLIVAK